MSTWAEMLRYDPVRPLMESGCEAVAFFTRRDLQYAQCTDVEPLWMLPEVTRLLKKQRPQGCFAVADEAHKALVETWRWLRFLVERYEMDRRHPAVSGASEYLFSRQSEESDIRGMLGNQYAPYYTGAMLYLLTRAGYADDPRVHKGIKWLLGMRQNDGGWVIGSPGLVHRSWKEITALTSGWANAPERDFDPALSFSAAGTGMAIRALAAHPEYRLSAEAKQAGLCLKSKILKKDNYTYMGHPDYWVRFEFPYWWNDLVSALDMLQRIGFEKSDKDIGAGLEWLVQHQMPDGLWDTSYSTTRKAKVNMNNDRLWVSLQICRILKRYDEG